MLDTMAQRVETRIIFELGATYRLDQRPPHSLVTASNIERPVGCLVHAMRSCQRMMVPCGTGSAAGIEVNPGRPGQHADDRLKQRGFDSLSATAAVTRLERQQDTLGGEDSSQQVANCDPNPHRTALSRSRHAHQAGE